MKPLKPSKKKIFDTAEKLMLKKGYNATTIDEICENTQLTKGSFFYYFKTKDQLGSELLDYYREKMSMKLENYIKKSDDPLENIFLFLDFVEKIYNTSDFEQSCLLGNFAQELAQTHESFRKQCDNHLSLQIENVKQLLDRAKKQYSVKSLDTESLAISLIALIQGSILISKSKKSKTVIRQSLMHFRKYLTLIFKGK